MKRYLFQAKISGECLLAVDANSEGEARGAAERGEWSVERESVEWDAQLLRDREDQLDLVEVASVPRDGDEVLDLKERLKAKEDTLEKMLKSAKEAFAIAQDAPELNMENYDHAQVESLNSAMIDIFFALDEMANSPEAKSNTKKETEK